MKTGFAFTNKRTNGDNSYKLLLGKGFPGGTRWLREGPECNTAVDYP